MSQSRHTPQAQALLNVSSRHLLGEPCQLSVQQYQQLCPLLTAEADMPTPASFEKLQKGAADLEAATLAAMIQQVGAQAHSLGLPATAETRLALAISMVTLAGVVCAVP